MLKKIVFVLLLAIAPVFMGTIAYAQNTQDMENRLRRLENELQTLGRAVFRGDVQQPPSSFQVEGGVAQQQQTVVANLGARLTQIESQMRNLNGALEEQSFQIRQLQNQVQTLSAMRPAPQVQQMPQQNFQTQAPSQNSVPAQQLPQPQNRMQGQPQMPTSGTVGANNLGQIVQSPDGQAVLNTENPAFLYDTAFSMLQRGEYAESANALNQFLQIYPSHPLAPNAQYWLGETFYVQNNFAEAAKSFARGYQQYPQSPKAPDSLLKLSLSLSNLGQNEEACITLGQLKQEYPRASSAIKEKADDEIVRLSCQL